MLHEWVQTTLKIVNHHNASHYPGTCSHKLPSESAEQAEQGKSTIMMLTCAPGPFAEYQDHTQGLLDGLGSCQL